MLEQTVAKKALPGSDSIFRQQYPNQTTFLAYPNLTSPAVYFRGYLPVGSVSDPAGKNGLANLNAALLSTGTDKHNFRQLHEIIESCGASISLSAGSLSTVFSGQCLKEDFSLILELLLEILSQPAYPQNHLERLQQQLATVFRIQAQHTGEMASQAFDRQFYREHPYAHPELGYAHTVKTISTEDLRAFHQNFFGPKGLVLAVSGGIDPQTSAHLFDQIFSAWQVPEQELQQELPPWQPLPQQLREHVPVAEKSQSDLIIGTIAPTGMSEEYQICTLGNNILGQFGMMGRIGESVRERSGLAYYAGSTLEVGLGPSAWKIAAGVNPDNLDRAISKILEEIKRFIQEPVSQSELSDVKEQALGSLPISLETNAGIVRYLLSLQRYNLSLDYLRELPEVLKTISAEDILTIARRYWDMDRLVIASAGREL